MRIRVGQVVGIRGDDQVDLTSALVDDLHVGMDPVGVLTGGLVDSRVPLCATATV
ncbi:hypothetical protein ACFRCI_20105 [Streptomyces sp. NPDC056638]|uniref:hypothetical protein n=1 Tax=Streptomyces sp. NPDC056638 TaxID=3345887 RepID=UPI00368642D0